LIALTQVSPNILSDLRSTNTSFLAGNTEGIDCFRIQSPGNGKPVADLITGYCRLRRTIIYAIFFATVKALLLEPLLHRTDSFVR